MNSSDESFFKAMPTFPIFRIQSEFWLHSAHRVAASAYRFVAPVESIADRGLWLCFGYKSLASAHLIEA
jgi:hypothetical protein